MIDGTFIKIRELDRISNSKIYLVSVPFFPYLRDDFFCGLIKTLIDGYCTT